MGCWLGLQAVGRGSKLGGRIRAAVLIWIAVPLAWSGCAKESSTASDVIVARQGELLTRAGFIASGQRVAELQSGGHPVQTCGVCHSSAFGGPEVNRYCPDCHTEEAAHLNHPVVFRDIWKMCVRCHMPYATFDQDSTNKYIADVRTHVFTLRVGPETRTSMFNRVDGGEVAAIDGGLTLDLACYQCHMDPAGIGGHSSVKSMDALAAKAAVIHSGANPPQPGREAK